MLKVLIEKLDNMQEWIGDFSIEQETVGKTSNKNTSNQKQLLFSSLLYTSTNTRTQTDLTYRVF